MKNLKKVLALVLAVVMIMGVVTVASAKTYKDADAEAFKNYADAIDALSSLKILDGFEDETFKANGTLTRAQAAKIVAIVHNAATNGRIQSDIADLYSNAQNPFVDCNTSWALPYINYCRITGLADGMTATTYAPKREVTGVQFLKLMLTTLNFDTAKEGYTGTGWDINVLNRANEIGLTAGLKDGWKAIAPITRGEAAQVLYNALTAYVVEYGQLIKGYYNKINLPVYNTAFVSNEQVNKAGQMLGEKMGISITRGTDAFRRPGYTWSYRTWSAFYMDAPIGEYKTTVSACDILKNDIGIAETSTKTVTLSGGNRANAVKWDAATKAWVADNDQEKLSYVAVDGYKWASTTLGHDKDKKCQDTKGDFRENKFGGQGDLTQVFRTEDGYIITVIHTFLADVTEVKLNNKYSHATSEASKVSAWILVRNDTPAGEYKEEVTVDNAMGVSTTAFAKGDKVLVTITRKGAELVANGTWNTPDVTSYSAGAVVDIAAAEAKTGKLTGASDLAYAESVSIDGTKYPTACRFVLGKDAAMKFANYNKSFTFYFDSYGNVIGCTDPTTAASYVVMDRIYGTHENGKFVVKADLYDLDGKKIEAATIAQDGSFAGVKDGYGRIGNDPHYTNDGYIYMVDSHNDDNLINALYTYTVDDKGAYTLTWVGEYSNSNPTINGYGRLQGEFTHVAKLAYISGTAYVVGNKTIALSESTKFVVKSVGGEWTSYTGYTALPALTAAYVDYLDNDGDGYADIVYLGNATFAGDSITGWVTNWGRFNWANGYDLVTVYVAGEPVVVNVPNPLGTTDSSTLPLGAGMYTFEIGKDKNGVAYATAYKRTADISGFVALGTVSKDTTAITLQGGEVIGLTDVAIYAVNADGTVTKADASVLTDGDYVEYFKEGSRGSAPYAELYVIDKNLYSSLYTPVSTNP